MVEEKEMKQRLRAYKIFLELKQKNHPKKEIVDSIRKKFKIPTGTVYHWFYGASPYGCGANIAFCKELFYVLGALLGDGCAYKWKNKGRYRVAVYGEYTFTRKYAHKLSKCIGRKTKNYPNRGQNIWFVCKCNKELYFLFKKIRKNPAYVLKMIKEGNSVENSLEFIEGFFDAEGCVKVIKEKVRKLPKICLDMTNTNKEYLDVVQILLKNVLEIEARYSIQKAKPPKNRKVAYHLRIYKKLYVQAFFDNMQTIKLKGKKKKLLKNWLEATEWPSCISR